MTTPLSRGERPWDEDRELPEDAAIEAAFPTRSERHDLYAEAMRLVGAKRSKGALVCLVNWLLIERERAGQAGREAGFREGVEAAAKACYGGGKDPATEWDIARSYCARIIRKLTCPPAADGSEGSDGE